MKHTQIPCHDEDFSGYCASCSYVGEDHRRDDIALAHRRAMRGKQLQSAYSMLGCAVVVGSAITMLVGIGFLLGRM